MNRPHNQRLQQTQKKAELEDLSLDTRLTGAAIDWLRAKPAGWPIRRERKPSICSAHGISKK